MSVSRVDFYEPLPSWAENFVTPYLWRNILMTALLYAYQRQISKKVKKCVFDGKVCTVQKHYFVIVTKDCKICDGKCKCARRAPTFF